MLGEPTWFNWHGFAGKEDRATALFWETNTGNNSKRQLEPWKELWKRRQEQCSALPTQSLYDSGPTLFFIVFKMTRMCIYSLLGLGILDKYVCNIRSMYVIYIIYYHLDNEKQIKWLHEFWPRKKWHSRESLLLGVAAVIPHCSRQQALL